LINVCKIDTKLTQCSLSPNLNELIIMISITQRFQRSQYFQFNAVIYKKLCINLFNK